MKFVFGIVGLLVLTGLSAPQALADYPGCMEIQQPRITLAVATEEGVQYGWESKGGGATYSILIRRYYDGAWHDESGWNDVRDALGTFVPWDKDFKVADSVSLQVVQNCYGRAWGVPETVQRSSVVQEQPQTLAAPPWINLNPNKDWSEIVVYWPLVTGATEYELVMMAAGDSKSCTVTVTGSKYLWHENSQCPNQAKNGSYWVNVVAVAPNLRSLPTMSEMLQKKAPKIRCVKKSSLKVKSFQKKKCPKGWVKR